MKTTNLYNWRLMIYADCQLIIVSWIFEHNCVYCNSICVIVAQTKIAQQANTGLSKKVKI